jgi:hypothetical protein
MGAARGRLQMRRVLWGAAGAQVLVHTSSQLATSGLRATPVPLRRAQRAYEHQLINSLPSSKLAAAQAPLYAPRTPLT